MNFKKVLFFVSGGFAAILIALLLLGCRDPKMDTMLTSPTSAPAITPIVYSPDYDGLNYTDHISWACDGAWYESYDPKFHGFTEEKRVVEVTRSGDGNRSADVVISLRFIRINDRKVYIQDGHPVVVTQVTSDGDEVQEADPAFWMDIARPLAGTAPDVTIHVVADWDSSKNWWDYTTSCIDQ